MNLKSVKILTYAQEENMFEMFYHLLRHTLQVSDGVVKIFKKQNINVNQHIGRI